MDIDILITGVTGYVGRFVLLNLLENQPDKKLAVIIRPSKKSPTERFYEEIICDTMFSRFIGLLSNVTIISASLEDIEKTALIIQSVGSIIHCAANVKHYDPYEKLVTDNVNNVRVILKLAETLNCKKLILLSTCYVHPKNGQTNGEIMRIPNTARDEFFNDYCYTKWLGEEEVFGCKSSVNEIHIVRLSCVGSPVRKDLQSHPFSAQAHLGILSLACRGYLTAIGLTADARLSIIPVDLATTYIVGLTLDNNSTNDKISLHQVCPSKKLDNFHPKLMNLFSITQYELGISTLKTVIHDGVSANYLPIWYSVLRYFNKKADRFVDLHNKIQEFCLLFTSPDIRFDSSIKEFPDVSEQDLLLTSYQFSIRTAHQLQFKKGLPLSLTDKFWHNTGGNEFVQACVQLRTPVAVDDIEDLKKGFWSMICTQRKFMTRVSDGKWVYKPGLFEEYFSTVPFSSNDNVTEALIFSKGLAKLPSTNLWHLDLITNGDSVTHLLFQFNHGLTDGIGIFRALGQLVDPYVLAIPAKKFVPPAPRKSLSIFQEILASVVYFCVLIISYFSNDKYECDRVLTPSVATGSDGIVKHSTFSYTTNLLWKLTKSLAGRTQKRDFLYVVPAVISVERSANEILHNNFVALLLPVSVDMSEEAFEFRCSFLRSKAVLFLMYCFQQLISYEEWWWLRDALMSKVTAVISSLNFGDNVPSAFSSVHVATTLPKPIPFGVTAVSSSDKTHITVRSHDSAVSADKILADLSL